MKHVKQKEGLGTCGAVAYAAILEISELQGIRECKTKMRGKGSGTHHVDVKRAFMARGYQSHGVNLRRSKIKDIFWLAPLSTHFPIYAAISKRKNGSTHAIAVADKQVYDGHNDGPVPLDLYGDQWIEDLLIVDKELETYQ